MISKPNIALSDAEWDIVSRILQRYLPDQPVWAFGSRARHTHKPYSDLDLVVMSNQPVELATMADLAEAFSSSDLPWKVDIVDSSALSNEFRAVIDAEKVQLH